MVGLSQTDEMTKASARNNRGRSEGDKLTVSLPLTKLRRHQAIMERLARKLTRYSLLKLKASTVMGKKKSGVRKAKTKGINWNWISLDGAMTKAPLGGEETGNNPTDRAKKGLKEVCSQRLVEFH